MNSLRKLVGFLTVLMLAGGALFSSTAFAVDKHYTLAVTPASGASPLTMMARFTNQGNSSFNSLVITAPDGVEIVEAAAAGGNPASPSSSRGTPSIVGSGSGNKVQVININLPTGTLQFVDVWLTMRQVTAATCPTTSSPFPWPGTKLNVYTGSSLTGQRFALDSAVPTTSFTQTCVTLTYNAGTCASISGTSPQYVLAGGSGTQVTAVPATGYDFVSWSDGITAASRTDSSVGGSKSVTASCEIKKFTLTYTAGANGSITGLTPQTVPYNTNGLPVTAEPATGYNFVSWNDGLTTATRMDKPTTTDIDVTASFAIKRFTLTYTANANGSIVGTSPQTNVAYSTPGTAVTAVPSAGYRFVRWSDGVSTAQRTDTPLTVNVNVAADFGGTLSFGTSPHNALAGALIGPVTVACNNFSGAATVTLSIDQGGLTGNPPTACVDGVASFPNVGITSITPAGNRTLTATTNEYPSGNAATAAALFVSSTTTGVLTCPSIDPTNTSTGFGGSDGSLVTTGSRGENKDLSTCEATPFLLQVTKSSTEHKVTILWDEVSQPYAVLRVTTDWPPERVGGTLLPKPTLYDVGMGTFIAGTCLSKTAPPALAGPPEQMGTLAMAIDNASTSIKITFSGALPAYPFPIVIRSSEAGKDPERMLVTGAGTTAGTYNVVRGTGLTQKSAHSALLPVMWTPLPVDDGSGVNAPRIELPPGSGNYVGAVVPVCVIQETFTTVPTDACSAWTGAGEPPPCVQTKSILWAIGDLTVSRTP